MLGYLAFVFILGSAVILHEFGHFIVAKLLGIRVETFSVGFGKRLWGRKWGTTDYRLSLIPLGGYVKLGGDDSNAGIEDGGAEEIPTKERFDLRPRYQKFMVGVAGPVMNILTALAIPFVAAMTVGVPALTPVVSRVEQGGAAETAGLRPGDRIISFDGENDPTWRWMNVAATVKRTQQLPVVVERGGERLQLSISPRVIQENGHEIGDLGFDPDWGVQAAVVERTIEGSPAAVETGLRPGDRLLALDGEPVRNPAQISDYIRKHPGQIRFSVEREGQRVELTTPERRMEGNTLGFLFQKPPVETVGPVEALSVAVNANIEILRLTGLALGQVFTGQLAVGEAVGGPIAIAKASYDAATNYGWDGVFTMLGFLSLNLGIFNLLPIPVLDGGMLFMLLIEGALAIFGLKISLRVRERIQQVGFVFLLLLMGFVIINDVTKLAPSIFRSKEQPAATQQK